LRYNFQALQGAERSEVVVLGRLSKPIRTVLCWQVAATAVIAAVAAVVEGANGAVSAIAGGLVSMLSGLGSAVVAARSGGKSAGGILVGALRAEGVKLALIVILLWLVLATYHEIVPLAFFGSFIATILIFTMAFFVRDN
jgi:ATP synthase protein I